MNAEDFGRNFKDRNGKGSEKGCDVGGVSGGDSQKIRDKAAVLVMEEAYLVYFQGWTVM